MGGNLLGWAFSDCREILADSYFHRKGAGVTGAILAQQGIQGPRQFMVAGEMFEFRAEIMRRSGARACWVY